MNKITTVAQLKAYALRKLGSGIVNIEITPEQQDDLMDDAIQMFGKYHLEGFTSTFSLLTLERGKGSYVLDDDIMAIPWVVKQIQEVLSEPTFSIQWEFLNERRWIGDIDLIGFELLMEKMKMIDIKFRQETGYEFNTTTHVLQLIPVPDAAGTLALKVYKMNDPYDFPDIYNNEWLKKYIVALYREQWGDNLTKYKGVPLPGGAQLNADGIQAKGEKDKLKLEDDLQLKHSLPIDIILG